jgi:hypothetical protein
MSNIDVQQRFMCAALLLPAAPKMIRAGLGYGARRVIGWRLRLPRINFSFPRTKND